MNVMIEIKEAAKTKPVLCLFDMDGTCVEYGSGEKAQIMANKKDFFKFKRPLKSILKKMKILSKTLKIIIMIIMNM